MHLVLDVGNTETAVGLFRPGELELEAHWRLTTTVPRTADEYVMVLRSLVEGAGYSPGELSRAVLGSVVPESTEVLRTTLERLVPGGLVVVESDAGLPIELDVEEPRTVGPDRVVNTLAASRIFGRDTVTVDLGTATTFDVITAEGVFLGGVIAPGVMAGLDWLSRRTAKLPRVELRPPEKVIGRRTETCLHSGIFYATVDAVDGIVRRILDEWDRPDPLVVATGGFASVIAPHSQAVARTEPFLTLYGFELAGRHLSGDDL